MQLENVIQRMEKFTCLNLEGIFVKTEMKVYTSCVKGMSDDR